MATKDEIAQLRRVYWQTKSANETTRRAFALHRGEKDWMEREPRVIRMCEQNERAIREELLKAQKEYNREHPLEKPLAIFGVVALLLAAIALLCLLWWLVLRFA